MRLEPDDFVIAIRRPRSICRLVVPFTRGAPWRRSDAAANVRHLRRMTLTGWLLAIAPESGSAMLRRAYFR